MYVPPPGPGVVDPNREDVSRDWMETRPDIPRSSDSWTPPSSVKQEPPKPAANQNWDWDERSSQPTNEGPTSVYGFKMRFFCLKILFFDTFESIFLNV